MSVRRGVAALALTALAGVALVGCGDDEPDAQDPASAEPSGSGTPPTTDDPGVEITGLPGMEGPYATALETYVDFEEGRRLVARTGEMNQRLSFSAVGGLADRYRQAADELAAAGTTYDGTVVVEVVDVRTRDTVVLIDLCVDATALVVPDGAPELLGRAVRSPERVAVVNLEGPWRVTRTVSGSGSC